MFGSDGDAILDPWKTSSLVAPSCRGESMIPIRDVNPTARVAYWAHIGGFLFGLAVALSLRRAAADAPAVPV
jgi:membrane associated rhomboid family serine protease